MEIKINWPRILYSADIYGYRMTGLLGKGGKWFVGLSRVMYTKESPRSASSSIEKMGERIKQLEYELGLTEIELEYKTRNLSQCEAALQERDGL